jgi:hypothetical protein
MADDTDKATELGSAISGASAHAPDAGSSAGATVSEANAQTPATPPSSNSQKVPVVILGDMQIDSVFAEEMADRELNSGVLNWQEQRQRHVIQIRRGGGIWLLRDVLANGLAKLVAAESFPSPDERDKIERKYCPESVAQIALFARKRDSKPTDKVFRLKEPMWWINRSEPSSAAQEVPDIATCLNEAEEWCENGLAPIVVLWDRNNGFRDNWPKGKTSPKEGIQIQLLDFLKFVVSKNGYVVWQRSSPCHEGGDPLWQVMFDPANENILKRTIAMIRSPCLRKSGMRVTQETSVEQVVEDFAAGLDSQPLQSLAKCQHLVVWYQEGAILLSQDEPQNICYFYCPNAADEITSTERGRMSGYTMILAAAIVNGLATKLPDDNKEPLDLQKLYWGVSLGVLLAALHCRRGYATKEDHARISSDSLPQPYTRLFQNPRAEVTESASTGIDTLRTKEEYLLAMIEFPRQDAIEKRLSRIRVFLRERTTKKDIAETIFKMVRDGLTIVGRKHREKHPDEPWFPESEITCAFAKFGKIETSDRHEVEKYMGIHTLIRNYCADHRADRPFSIATFGPPGSGKSFAIKSIIEDVNSDAARYPLEFNVAQFTRIEDLAAVFHQAHDRAIEGVLPLVVFDEFDTAFRGDKLGWLKYFLAPMQDGLFKDGTKLYRVGRAIFLFTGGTKHTFEEFCERIEDREFVDAKGPDFISRLRGHLNVQSIDSQNEEVDTELMFRRAMLLRSILMRKRATLLDGESLRIDAAVINAFLRVPRYRHGVRSMEAIIEMSKATPRFEKSSLPSPEQLRMHVDVHAFFERLEEI